MKLIDYHRSYAISNNEIVPVIVCLLLCFWFVPGRAQGLLLVLCSDIVPGKFEGPYAMPEIEPGSIPGQLHTR